MIRTQNRTDWLLTNWAYHIELNGKHIPSTLVPVHGKLLAHRTHEIITIMPDPERRAVFIEYLGADYSRMGMEFYLRRAKEFVTDMLSGGAL